MTALVCVNRRGVVNPVTAPNDTHTLRTRWGWRAGDGPGVLFLHGRSGNSFQVRSNPFSHIDALAAAGFAVLGLDLTGPTAYGHPSAVATVTEGVNYLLSTVGVAGTKVGLFGWSMGGLSALNYLVRNSAKVAGVQLWSPLLDLDWSHGAAANGWTSPWTLASQISAAAGEIDTAYTNVGANQGSASTTATGTVTVAASGGAGVTVPLTTTINFGDPATKGSDSRTATVTIGGVLCSYTGISGSSLTGVVSTTASTVAVVNGTVVSTNYAGNSVGYDPMRRLADVRALATPITVVHASDDTVIPPVSSSYWAGASQANKTLRGAPTGGHNGQFFNVPTAETVQLFRSFAY